MNQEKNYSVTNIVQFYTPKCDYYKISKGIVYNKNWVKSIYYQKYGNNIDPIKDIILEWQSKKKKKQKIGLLFHKLIEFYYLFGNDFNIDFFFIDKQIEGEYKYILKKLIKTMDKFLTQQKNYWRILYFEHQIIYKNILGKPDAIFEYVKTPSQNYYKNLFIHYYNDIIKGFKDRSIIDMESFDNNIYMYNSKNHESKKVILVDWKCIENNIFQFVKNKNLNFFLRYFLYNSKYNQIVLQMNLYKYMLENQYDYNISELFCFIINSNTCIYKLIPIIILKKSFVLNIFNFFLQNINIVEKECLDIY